MSPQNPESKISAEFETSFYSNLLKAKAVVNLRGQRLSPHD